MNQQEYLIKLSAIQQEAERLEQKMQIIDQQIQEMQAVKLSLENLRDKKEGSSEILSNLGKGIFVKTVLKSRELFVNVGRDIVVKKSADETISILDEQVGKLIKGKTEIMARIEWIQDEMQGLVKSIEVEGRSEEES